MENKQAVAVAVGVGAVGTALAYLGYSVYNNNADILLHNWNSEESQD